MIDQIRSSFEKEFPVPDGVYWNGDRYTYDSGRNYGIALNHEILWSGYLAGWRASK